MPQPTKRTLAGYEQYYRRVVLAEDPTHPVDLDNLDRMAIQYMYDRDQEAPR